jgi:hypothetical protein
MRHATFPGVLFEPIGRALGRLLAFVEGVAFWAAAMFPFVHVGAGLLYVQDSIRTEAFVGLALLNAAAIVVGHRYDRDRLIADE